MVLPIVGAALVGGLSTALNNRSQRRAHKKNQKATEKFNREQREYQAQRDAVADAQYERSFAFNEKQADRSYELAKRPVTTHNEIDLVKLREESEAAGLNFITAVRSGLGASFGATTTTGGGALSPIGAPSPGVGGGGGGGLAPPPLLNPMASPLAAAINTGFNAWANQPDPEREALEKDLLRAQVEESQSAARRLSAPNFGYSIPTAVNTTGIHHGQVGSDTVTVASPDRTSVRVAGTDVLPDHGYSDAEAFEQRYGDFASSVIGLGVMTADARNTYGPKLRGIVRNAGVWAQDRLLSAGQARDAFTAWQLGRFQPVAGQGHGVITRNGITQPGWMNQ